MSLRVPYELSRASFRRIAAAVALAVAIPLAVTIAVHASGAVQTPPASVTFTTIYTFTGQPDGAWPNGGLVSDAQGNLYGTTGIGGSSNTGTVFEITPSGTESVLTNFNDGDLGGFPLSGVILDDQGNIYGTTESGNCNYFDFCVGLVYKLDKTRTETVIYYFQSELDGLGQDGDLPYSGLVMDSKGFLVGTAFLGGDLRCGTDGCGVVYIISPDGEYTVLHRFRNGDGHYPNQNITLDTAGNVYGTTPYGGQYKAGAVFKIDTTGKETLLYSFHGAPDGRTPSGALVSDQQGNFYSTTSKGGAYNQGTIFKLDPSGNETILYSFRGDADGGFPFDGTLVRSGNVFLGTTALGGDMNCGGSGTGCGVIYQVDLSGKETVLHTFHSSDGNDPHGPLLSVGKGNFYGTTYSGGSTCLTYGCGTVFKLTIQ